MFFREIHRKLDFIIDLLREQRHREIKIMATIDDVQAAVAAETTEIGSVVTLLGQLHDMVLAAGTDPAKLQAALDSINANKDALAAAVLANTPSAPVA